MRALEVSPAWPAGGPAAGAGGLPRQAAQRRRRVPTRIAHLT
ncbi:hypothetical protein [Acidovorax sp. FG27]